DVIAMAQGLTVEAGIIQIVRRTNPSEPQTGDQGTFPSSDIRVDIADLMGNGRNELNIPVQTGDIINVLAAPPQSIFIVGEMIKPGEYPVKQGRTITLTQALALGGGFNREAKKSACLIIRYRHDRSKEEIPVD